MNWVMGAAARHAGSSSLASNTIWLVRRAATALGAATRWPKSAAVDVAPASAGFCAESDAAANITINANDRIEDVWADTSETYGRRSVRVSNLCDATPRHFFWCETTQLNQSVSTCAGVNEARFMNTP